MWAKRYILQYQCHYHYTHNTTHHLIHYKRYIEPTCPEIFHGYSNPLNSSHILLSTLLGTTFNAKEIQNIDKKLQNETILQNFTKFYLPSHLITHVYYTESDQMLFFESSTLRNIILKSLNISIHVIGRRREKVGHSNPYQPFNDLYPTRHLCGNVSDPYVLDTDVDCFIRRESHKR